VQKNPIEMKMLKNPRKTALRKTNFRTPSERMEITQPRVARNELPWVGGPLKLNPERVLSTTPNEYLEQRTGERRPFNAAPLNSMLVSPE
jgi:hypothetical protein